MELPLAADGVVNTGAGDAAGSRPLLALEGITRRFGRVVALDGARLVVRAGTVHAVLGENGAGKTTLLRVAFGMVRPDAGSVALRGVQSRIASPADALDAGIGMVHQHFTLVPAMTVAENVALGGHGRFDPKTAAARVRETAAGAGLSLDPDAIVGTLPVGAQQRCEIVKALARDVQLLILDEPTAVLAPSEAAELLRWMRRHADAGHAVVLITHKLRDALAIADDVTVLRRGRTVLETRAADTSEHALVAAMLGDDARVATRGAKATVVSTAVPDATTPAMPTVAAGDVVLDARGLRVLDDRGVARVRDASLQVRAGEIVGIAAVEGAGQRELLRVLAGRSEPTAGTLVRPDDVAFVPEDRHHEALLLDSPLFENVALRGAGSRRGRIDWSAMRERARAIIEGRDVRTSSELATVRTLSGGNQQKLVVGRELADAPRLVVLENPSRGLDIRATTAVHDAVRRARDAGAAVVLYSSDLDEVLALADRVLAMHDGHLDEPARDRDSVGRAMLSTTADTAPSPGGTVSSNGYAISSTGYMASDRGYGASTAGCRVPG